MSASVLARSYNDTPSSGQPLLQLPSASGSRISRPPSVQRPPPSAVISSMKGERARNGGPSSSTRISFATDTSFHERTVRSRKASSLNLRVVQGSERPSKVRIRIPKATTATGMRKPSASHDDYINPRKAVEIARSYGIPKYFLRSNSQQILTDGRMRLFGDNIWKKERTSLDLDRQNVDSSDVINRLMDSVNRAIETSQKRRNVPETDDTGVQLEVISLKSGGDEVDHVSRQLSEKGGRMTREHSSSLDNVSSLPSESRPITQGGGGGGLQQITQTPTVRSSLDSKLGKLIEMNDGSGGGGGGGDLRPHTVDTLGSGLTGYLPKMTFKDSDNNRSSSVMPGTPSTGGIRLKQLASPFKAVSDFTLISEKAKSLDDKYHNVLPRFYPAVSAHQYKQNKVDVDKMSQRNRKKANQNRLVRFADSHTVRFANDSTAESLDEDSLGGMVVKRAPVQSIQRALDSHSCLGPIDKNKNKFKDNNIIVNNKSNSHLVDPIVEHSGNVNGFVSQKIDYSTE